MGNCVLMSNMNHNLSKDGKHGTLYNDVVAHNCAQVLVK